MTKHVIGCALVLLVCFLATDAARAAETARPATPRTEALARKWLQAVKQGDVRQALDLAQRLSPAPANASVPPDVAQMAERDGIKAAFFSAPYNVWDARLWQDAVFFKTLAENTTGGDPKNVRALYDLVRSRIQNVEKPGSYQPPWPRAIWDRGFGVCDRMAWVLAEMAWQLGWETQIVYLRDPETNESPHTIAELRHPDGTVVFADPYADVWFPGRSVKDVADDPAVLSSIWENTPQIRPALANSVFWTPACPQDYCPKNQSLATTLENALGPDCPRFGDPPKERLDRYRQMSVENVFATPAFPMELWFYPFRLLRSDIIRHARMYGVQYLK